MKTTTHGATAASASVAASDDAEVISYDDSGDDVHVAIAVITVLRNAICYDILFLSATANDLYI